MSFITTAIGITFLAALGKIFLAVGIFAIIFILAVVYQLIKGD